MSERLKFRGRLEELKIEARDLRLRMDGIRESIRDLLDPFEKHEGIKADVAAAQAVEYADLQVRLKEVLSEIAAVEKALGRR